MSYRKVGLCLVTLFIFLLHLPAQEIHLVEAEAFQFKGGWGVKGDNARASGGKYLSVLSGDVPASDAFTVINIKSAGLYYAWTRSRDYPGANPGTRLYRMKVNQQPMKEESGKHGLDGYHWEKVGEIQLEAGEAVISINDTRTNYGRCDAVLLSSDVMFDPEKISLEAVQVFTTTPVQMSTTIAYTLPASPLLAFPQQSKPIAVIGNNNIRLRFAATNDNAGVNKIVSKTEIKKGNEWISLNDTLEDHHIALVASAQPELTFGGFYPAWNRSLGKSIFTSKGKTYSILDAKQANDPYQAGTIAFCTASSVQQITGNSVKVIYKGPGGEVITGTWMLKPGANHFTLTLQHAAAQDGFYSFAVNAFQPVPEDQLLNVQLPPMYQYQRVPPSPLLLPGALVTQPVAIAERKTVDGSISLFIAGATSMFPLSFNSANESRIGLSLKNEKNEIQPVAFAPVLGLADSKLSKGQVLQRSFEIGLLEGNWTNTMSYVSDSIFKVSDYRSQTNTSLTDAALNIVDLLRSDESSGFDPELKGFYDIEADPKLAITVAQSAPLAVISSAVIGKDENFYIKRALPTIEYTLSRSGFRWAKANTGASFATQVRSLELSPYSPQFGAAYFEALHRLLGSANPWIYDLAFNNKQPRKSKGNAGFTPAWSDDLAIYRLTGDKKWLQAATVKANDFVANEVYGKKTKPLDISPFYNVSFYPSWWYLLDIYELSGDKKFLDAAADAAFYTIAGVRSYPFVEDKLQTIHPGNKYGKGSAETGEIWWKAGKKFRLGFPRKDGDVMEKQVPQSLVSPVGLGFEQPFTMFRASSSVHNVYMSSWAPHLLKLFQYDKRKIFETYARNAIIGRFSNYPGYYASGYTDLPNDPAYPIKGPDVTGIYFHHISPHLAFTWDYVITEAVQRTNGKVNFPYGKQEGFVWFNNRVYGVGQGTILDDQHVQLWIKKGVVSIDKAGVNYISGISNDRFWLVLLSEENSVVQATITLGREIAIADNSQATIYSDKTAGNAPTKMIDKKVAVSISPKGYTIISFPLIKKQNIAEALPVKNGMQMIELGDSLGNFYAFRIRSPFGWDSFYGYIDRALPKGAEAVIQMAGQQAVVKNAFPFEWTLVRLASQQALQAELKISIPGRPVKAVAVRFAED